MFNPFKKRKKRYFQLCKKCYGDWYSLGGYCPECKTFRAIDIERRDLKEAKEYVEERYRK